MTLRLTVVYADDDELVRAAVTDLLVAQGLDVHACGDGDEALALCKQMQPDAVLLDLNMPEMNGLQVARALRMDAGNRPLRLVAMTGRRSDELRKKAFDAGFDEFLSKPASLAAMLDALRPRTDNAVRE
ncbi:MAG TPA: response regulator [Rhodanobacteraceae bacterium]|nr:response regulator [Rhodanobacteraceae bacterium]